MRSPPPLLQGIFMALYPPAGALLGLLDAPRIEHSRLRREGWLSAGLALLAVPPVADVVAGRAGRVTLTEALEIAALLTFAAAGYRMGRAGRTVSGTAFGLAVGVVLWGAVSLALWAAQGGRVSGWMAHPNSWGALAVLPTALVTASRPPGWAVAAALAGASAAAVASGSRAATLGVAIVVVFAVMRASVRTVGSRAGGRFAWVLAVASVALLAALASLQPRLWRGAVELFAAAPDWGGQEGVLGAPQALGVSAQDLDDGTLRLVREREARWSRYQWPMILFPETTYSASWEIRNETPGAAPGVLGVVRGDDEIEVRLGPAGWEARSGGDLEMLQVEVVNQEDGWVAVALSFRSNAGSPSRLWIGPAPDLACARCPAALTVRRAVAVRGTLAELGARGEPRSLSVPTVEALSRISAFRAAWNAFLERPVLGHRGQTFSDYYRSHPPDQNTSVPAHAHNELLQALFQRGAVGAAGLVLLTGWALASFADSSERTAAVLVAALVVVLNQVDTLLLNTWMLHVLVLFAALAGVGAGAGRRDAPEVRA